MPTRTFVARVVKVEEQFETAIKNATAYGEARAESQAQEATEKISKGWWVSLEGFGVAFFFGKEKPGLVQGDIMYIDMRWHIE